jgi:asparagine synthase (glutamine-hydrolysing)
MMCGFTFKAKIPSSRDECLEEFDSSAQDLSHRGPDEKTLVKSNEFEMNFFRLAIRDLNGGQQPFPVSGDVYSMVNGELYNEDLVRELLSSKGIHDLPSGDMNLMTFFLHTFGVQSIDKLDGMFAGVIHDQKNAKAYLFRDRTGEKPLYYHLSENYLYVSSEVFWVKDFVRQSELEIFPEIQIESSLRGIWPYESQFRNVMKALPPGNYAEIDLNHGTILLTEYWSWPKRFLTNRTSTTLNMDYLDRLDLEITKAVSSRLVSDYPIATLLSGGIDSGLITAIANSGSNNKCTAFTLDFKDSIYSEASAARQTSNYIGIRHEVVSISNKEFATLVEECIAAMDVPILDSGALSLFAISKYLGQEFKVALSGDGGDELFMGYNLFSHFSAINYGLAHRASAKLGIRALIGLTSFNQNSYLSLNMKALRMNTLLHNSSLPTVDAALSPFAGTPIFEHLSSRLPMREHMKIAPEDIENYYRQEVLPKLYLAKSDRMSMRHGVELRSPFLSPKLIEIASELTAKELISHESKLPLRMVARRYLPKSIFNLPKHGFSSPFAEIRGYLQEPLWNLESMSIPDSLASKVWNTKNENSGIASWSLLVLNNFINRKY